MKMNVKGNDNFQTPDHLFDQLNRIFNFTLDAACTTEDCKCASGLCSNIGVDALKMSWGGIACFAIRHLVRRPPLSKKLITKLSMEIALFALWCFPLIAKTAKLFKSSLRRISFMKPYAGELLSLIQKQNNQ